MSKEDYETLQAWLNEPKLFWLKVFLTMTFKYGFREGELLNAKVSYFNAKESTFTLPAFTAKNKQERIVDLVPNGEIHRMLLKLTDGRKAEDALFTRNGKPVRDFRGEWAKQTEGMTGGSGIGGTITIQDLRRSALTAMSEKGISAEQAGTHLTPDVFRRYISRPNANRRRRRLKGDMMFLSGAGVAELADAHDSKSCGLTAMVVRFHSPAPSVKHYFWKCSFFSFFSILTKSRLLFAFPAAQQCKSTVTHKIILRFVIEFDKM
jgi:Phage integrase family